MDEITKRFRDHYSGTFAEHGATARGVDWGSDESVELRHEIMFNLLRHDLLHDTDDWKNVSVLDVGCGYGGFWKFLSTKEDPPRYKGIDVAPNMIESAARSFPEAAFECADLFDLGPEKKYDYVVCNGVLTQKLEASSIAMGDYALKLIDRLFSHARRGAAFNVMSTKVNYTVDNLYYRHPMEIFSHCLATLTPRIRVDHAYPLYEYTVYLYREP